VKQYSCQNQAWVLKKSLRSAAENQQSVLEGFMLCWISMVGGLLIMMGHHSRGEALFYYFRLEDQVPENHLLRLIDKHISFEFVREQLKDSYSENGRPSIDPELLLRILLIGYLYGITSERRLVEELRMHLAWRWFTGLGFRNGIQRWHDVASSTTAAVVSSRTIEHVKVMCYAQAVETYVGVPANSCGNVEIRLVAG
jgi:transposase